MPSILYARLLVLLARWRAPWYPFILYRKSGAGSTRQAGADPSGLWLLLSALGDRILEVLEPGAIQEDAVCQPAPRSR